MRTATTPAAAELLQLWEEGRTLSGGARALLFLGAHDPGAGEEELGALTAGACDARIAELRRSLFGSLVTCVVDCPVCQCRVESRFQIEDLAPLGVSAPRPASVEAAGLVLEFRLPTMRDLMTLDPRMPPEVLRRRMIGRCVLSARRNGVEEAIRDLPEEAVSAMAEEMSRIDPGGDIQLAMTCPECHSEWSTVFDIQSYFWTELEAWAHRVLREVHELASAYGWTEREVLALSPVRRQAYLEMVRA